MRDLGCFSDNELGAQLALVSLIDLFMAFGIYDFAWLFHEISRYLH